MDSLPRDRGSSLEHHDWKAGAAAASATRRLPLGIEDHFTQGIAFGGRLVGLTPELL